MLNGPPPNKTIQNGEVLIIGFPNIGSPNNGLSNKGSLRITNRDLLDEALSYGALSNRHL